MPMVQYFQYKVLVFQWMVVLLQSVAKLPVLAAIVIARPRGGTRGLADPEDDDHGYLTADYFW